MVTKTKRNGGTGSNTHDKRHENGLAPPGKRITKQKSNPQLNGLPNGRHPANGDPAPPLPHPPHANGSQMTASTTAFPDAPLASPPALANTTAATASGINAAANGEGCRVRRTSEGPDACRHHHDVGISSSSSAFDMAPAGVQHRLSTSGRAASFYRGSNMLTVATTILSSCPLRDVLAILIILLQLPPTVLTVVQFLFATLTFVPPQAGTPLSALSAFPSFTDIFQGSGGTPSLFTIVFADALILLIWLVLWVPVQNFFLDLAQAVIAIALGGAAAGRNGTTNGIFICFIIILTNHLFRFRPLRQHIVHFLWTGLARGGLDFLTSPPSMPSHSKSFITPHGWPRSILGIHILAQGVVRIIRRSLSRREAAQSLATGKKIDPEVGGVHLARVPSVHIDGNADVPGSSSTDGRPPGPSPAAQKDKVSASRKKRKQATHVRSQQPFWAALASTKVTVLKEMESSRAANDAGEANAKDAHHIGNAIWAGEDDRVWISEVGHTDIDFRVRMGSASNSEGERSESDRPAGSGIDKSKPFYLRVNGADWSSTRIRDEGTGFWVGEIFGLTALSNYFCEFVRTVDDEVFYSASLITSTGPLDDQIASPPPHPTLRPSSPTTTLKNSIAAADQKLQDQRNRLKRNRKDHKAAITTIKKEVDGLNNRLANAGGSDERQRQRVLQFNQNIRQAEDAAADFALQIDSLGDIPQEELDDAAAKKKAWKKERDHKNAVATELENAKNEFERQANRVQADIASVLQKRERLNQRQSALNEKHERLITANREGLSRRERKEQERAAMLAEKINMEQGYRNNINHFEQRTNTLNQAISQLIQQIQQYESLLLQESQQQQQPSVPQTPEGPLPGTNNFSPHHANAFSSFAFPSLTAHVNSTPNSLRGGRGRSSSMLSNVSGFTDGFEEIDSPSVMTSTNPFDYYPPLNGIKSGSNGTGSASPSTGTSSQGSSQRDPLSPIPNKQGLATRSNGGGTATASPTGSAGSAKPVPGVVGQVQIPGVVGVGFR